MTTRDLSTYGGMAGFLLGIVITFIYDLPLVDAAFRLLILSVCGAWMGAIFSWLNRFLLHNEERDSV